MSFSIQYDAECNRIRAEISGLWTPATAREFAAATGEIAHRIRPIRTDYDVLVDSRKFAVQTAEVAAMLPSIANAGLSLTSGRGASVVGSTLNLLQAERTQTHPRLRIFTTMEDAEVWLDTPAIPVIQTELND